jgi:hypothetical protein
MMTPEERTQDDIATLRAQMNYQSQLDQFHRTDASDKANYQAKATVNKTYKKYEPQVEALLQQSRNSGWNIPREKLLATIIGEEVLGMTAKSSTPKSTPRRAVSKPVNSRGDSTSTSGARSSSLGKHEALKKRLENIPL